VSLIFIIIVIDDRMLSHIKKIEIAPQLRIHWGKSCTNNFRNFLNTLKPIEQVLQLRLGPQRHRRQRRPAKLCHVSTRIAESSSRREDDLTTSRQSRLGPNCLGSYLGLDRATFSRLLHEGVDLTCIGDDSG